MLIKVLFAYREVMHEPLDDRYRAVIILGILVVSQLFGAAFRFENARGRLLGLSLAALLGVTLVQLVMTHQRRINGGRFSWRRWLLLTTAGAIILAGFSALPEAIGLKLFGLVVGLIIFSAAMKKSVPNRPAVPDVLQFVATLLFALAMASMPWFIERWWAVFLLPGCGLLLALSLLLQKQTGSHQ